MMCARPTIQVLWTDKYRFPLLLNGILTSIFILVGTFTGLITLIGIYPSAPCRMATRVFAADTVTEMIKFFCYMMSVLGIFILRRRVDKQMQIGSQPTYKTYRTWVGNPIIFASVSGLLIARGALSAPLQAPAIFSIGVLALAVLYRKFSSRPYELPPPT